MEIVIAALIGAIPASLAALAARRGAKNTNTNGTNKTLGELAELMYDDLQTTKRDLAEHQRRTDAHGRK